MIKKWNSVKLFLGLLLFVEAGIFKYQGKIGDNTWLAASVVGTFGIAVIRAWLKNKGMNGNPEKDDR